MINVEEFVHNYGQRAILTILQDGRFYPVSDLAYMSGMTMQETRANVTELVEENIVETEDNGRHLYYGMDNTDEAEKVAESLKPYPGPEIKPLKQNLKKNAVSHARTCYSHIAGELGVKLTDAMIDQGFIVKDKKEFYVTDKGENFFHDMQIDVQTLRGGNKKCLDWTERKYHIAGPLGKAMLKRFLELKWIERVPDSRSLKITDLGIKQFKNKLAIEI